LTALDRYDFTIGRANDDPLSLWNMPWRVTVELQKKKNNSHNKSATPEETKEKSNANAKEKPEKDILLWQKANTCLS